MKKLLLEQGQSLFFKKKIPKVEFQNPTIQISLHPMNNLNPSIYSSLQDYQETYEFYRSRQEFPKFLRLKLVQNLWNIDKKKEAKAA